MAYVWNVVQWVGQAAYQAGSYLYANSGWVAAAAAAASAGASAYGSYKQGEAEREANYGTAATIDAQAKDRVAKSHYEMARMRRLSKAQRSEQQSLLAASGFDATDPTSLVIASETTGAATLEELLVKAQAIDEAEMLKFQASQLRKGGDNARAAGRIDMASTLLSRGSAWWDQYGSGFGRTGNARIPAHGVRGSSAPSRPAATGRAAIAHAY